MMTGFIESPRFPEAISYGSRGGPMYKTTVISFSSGSEQRNLDWSQARHSYNAAHGVKSQTDMEDLITFFHLARGRGYGFRFKDWNDYKSCGTTETVARTDQTQLTAVGGESQFQLTKTYELGGSETYVRKIHKPIQGTVLLEKNGALAVENTDYWIDYTKGIVSFFTAASPGDVWKAGYEFDVPCRFDIDQFSASFDDFQIGSVVLPVIELRLQINDPVQGPVSLYPSTSNHLHIGDRSKPQYNAIGIPLEADHLHVVNKPAIVDNGPAA